MQPENEIKPEPFDAAKFLVHLQKLNAENPPSPFTGIALLGHDDERVRDGAQREAYWINQIQHLQSLDSYSEADMAHAREELGHALFVQGRVSEALSLAQNPERRAYYASIQDAIEKDDDEFCQCPENEEVTVAMAGGTEIKTTLSQFWHTVGSFPSEKHGRMMPIQRCAICGFTNVTAL